MDCYYRKKLLIFHAGTAAEGVFGQLFPTAGLENGSCIVANFGAEPFEYNGLLEAGYSPKES